MPVDISGGEGSLFWEAGIDTNDFDAGMKQLTERIQQATKTQIQIQEQAATSQKQIAQQILQSAGAIKGVDSGLAAQLRNLSAFQSGIVRIGAEMTATTEDLQRQIQAMKSQTIELKAKGLDVTPLTASLDKVEAEVEKINSTPLDIATGKVDVAPLLNALHQVQAEYDKLSTEPIRLNVDAPGATSPLFAQASIDAFRQVKPAIIEAIQAYKELSSLSREGLQIKVEGVNTESVQKAFEGLQRRFEGLNNTALVLKVKGVDTASLTTAIDKAKADFEALRGLTLSPDMDLSQFQQQYKQLQGSLAALEAEKIQLRAEGVDTSKLERDIKNIRIQMAGLSREALRVKVDSEGLEKLEAQLEILKKQSFDLDFKGVDTAPVFEALEKIEAQIEKIKAKPVELRTGTINLGPLSTALIKVGEEVEALEGRRIELKAAGLDTSAVEADLARLREGLDIPPVEVPVKIGSLREKSEELQQLKQQFAELSEVDRNSNIGQGLVQNIQQLEGEVEKINGAFLKIEQHAAGSLNEKVATLARLKDQYAALSEIDRNSTAGRQMAQNIHNLDRDVQKVNQEFQQTESLAKKAAVALGAYFSLQAGANFIRDVIRVRGEFQKLQAVLSNSLGADEAGKVFDQLVKLAASTPAQLNELTGAYTKLVNQGIKPTMAEMQALSDVAAATGKGFDQLAEAIIDAQTGEFERLKEFGIRAEKAGDQVKFSFKGVETQVAFTSGAIKDYIVGLGKVEGVAGASAAIMGTLEGQISNLGDAWARMLNALGESNQGLLSGGISGLTTLVEHYQEVLDILTVLVAMYGTYKAAQLADIALKKIATTAAIKNALGETAVAVATGKVTSAKVLEAGAVAVSTGAWQALNVTMKANPALLIAGAIGTLATALILFNRVTKESAVAMNEYNAELEKEQKTLDGMFESAKGAAEGTQQRADAIKAINENYKDYLPQLLSEKTTNEQLADTYKILNARIAENMALKFKNKNKEDLNAKFGERNADIFNNIVGSITRNMGASQAGKAAAELNKLGDSLSGILGQIDTLKQQDRLGTQEAVSLFDQRNRMVNEFVKKYQLLPKHISAILEFAGNKNGLKKGLDNIDAFWKEIIKGNKKGAEATEKSLADYLKERNFASVFEQAFPLAKSKEDLDKVLQKLTAEKGGLNRTDKNFEKQVNYYQGLIDRVNKEIERFDPNKVAKKNQAAANAEEKRENKMNALLNAREALLQSIADKRAQAEAATNGKQVSEIEKINQEYDKLIRLVDEYNKKAGEWNKDPKNKNNKVDLIGFDVTRQINEARNLEVSQKQMEQDVANYEKSLKEKSDLYKQYQQTVQEVGKDDVDKLYDKEKLAFDSYLDYLKFELAKFGTKISLGIELNFADRENLKLVTQEVKKESDELADRQIENTKRVMVETANVASQRLAVEAKYQKDLAILKEQYLNKRQFTEFIERKKMLDQALQEDLKALAQHLGKQSNLYKQFNQKTYNDVRKRIDAEIEALADQLAVIEKHDPGMAKAIRAAIKEWQQLRGEMDSVANKSEEFTRGLQAAQNAFSDLSSLASGFDDELAEAFGSIGQLIGAFEDLQKAIDAIDSAENAGKSAIDDIMKSADLITAVVKAVIAAINVIAKDLKKVKESKIQSREEVDSFYAGIEAGEQAINELMRQRQRDMVALNKLTYERIAAERALLEEQKRAIQSQANTLMQQLQGESFVAGESVKKNSFWEDGIGRRRYVEKEYQSLLNKSFEEIEALYLKGQLEGKAKELFEQLQALKQQGADIDRMLEENKREAAQIFTGTTAEGIADVIEDGFAAGKRSVADFADSTEEIIRKALQNAFRYQFLEKEINKLYEQFAADAQSGGVLDQEEIQRFTDSINKTIKDSALFVEQLEKAAGISLSSATSQAARSNSLQGSIQALTEKTGELLAGQVGGLRLTALEHLRVASQSLSELNRIQHNTAATVQNTAIAVQHLAEAVRVLNGSASGNNPLHVKVR